MTRGGDWWLAIGFGALMVLLVAALSVDGAGAEGCRPPRTLKCDPLKWDARSQVRRALVADGLYWVWRSGIADRIIRCESGWNPDAVGDQGRALGLWQIRIDYHASKFDGPWDSPYWSTEAAVDVFREAGNSFSPWSCYR